MTPPLCPFKPADKVIYAPSNRAEDREATQPGTRKLVPGKMYTVERIEKGKYVVLEGYHHLGGGIYWTEFRPARQ